MHSGFLQGEIWIVMLRVRCESAFQAPRVSL
jgi:hypothetical protein